MDKCDEAMEQTLKAAHDVDVGDYSFEAKNYGGALLRYKDAAEEKPGDAAIHVRLGTSVGETRPVSGSDGTIQDSARPRRAGEMVK